MGIFYTCGDPYSINIEAFLRTIAPILERTWPVIGIGSSWQLHHQAEALCLPLPKIKFINQLDEASEPGIYWFDPWPQAPNIDARHMAETDRGRLALKALESVPRTFSRPAAVLTAPIHKKATAVAGFRFPGQTEFFEDLWHHDAVMMLAGPKLRVGLATNHLPLDKVSKAITAELIAAKVKILDAYCHRLFGIKKPRIGICGVNPHAGDGGLFGQEEQNILIPVIQDLRKLQFDVTGPIAADTAFYRAYHGEFDAILAMYHDQGLGPLKSLHFDEAVNISMGLPHLRVSPDHGPASDLYLTGRASLKSFELSANLCDHWLTNRGDRDEHA